MTMNFVELTAAVGKWSQRNFGDQDGLNEIAPFLGMIEELQDEAPAAKTLEQVKDAYADTVIFFADFCYRAGIPVAILEVISTDLDCCSLTVLPSDRPHLSRITGRLTHILLKRRQRIRGQGKLLAENTEAVTRILQFACSLRVAYQYAEYVHSSLDDVLEPCTPSLLEVAVNVWETTVSKRDWTRNKEKGV